MSFNILFPKGKIKSNSLILKDEFDCLGVSTLLGSNSYTYFTNDAETIKYRLDIFNDMINIVPLQEVFKNINEMLKEYSYYKNMREAVDNAGLFKQLTDIKFYTDFIDKMYNATKTIYKDLKADGLIKLADFIKEEAESEHFIELKEAFNKLDKDLLNIKSITVGINLDSNLNPKEAGLLKINSEVYKSGNLIDKFLRMEYKESDFHCIAPLTVFSLGSNKKEQIDLNTAINNSMAVVLSESLKKCRYIIKAFLNEKMRMFLDMIDEFYFISRATDLLLRIKDKGLPLCKPSVTDKDRFFISNLYPIQLMNVKTVDEIVPNDVVFDDDGQIFILTGPNSGGKTVYIYALGIAKALYQCGLLIPARNAAIPLMDKICTHFTLGNTTAAHSIGRLEEECQRISVMLDTVTADTLVLMDEAFSSTSAKDGLELAESTIYKMRAIRCKCIFSTHIHELSERVDIINTQNISLPKLDKLAVVIKNGERTYKIRRGFAEGTSDAKTIAHKYGLI